MADPEGPPGAAAARVRSVRSSRGATTIAELDLVRRRLRNQKLVRSAFHEPAEVVAWLCAVQAQDYAGARWALGLRASGITDKDVEQAFDAGAILRTHVMRPTWHFVTPADIRWLMTLTAPRVHARSAYYYRQHELDARTFARSRSVLERALRGHQHRTRAELAAALRRAGITGDGTRLGHLLMHAELEQVICSGPRRGKQFTYALLEDRAPRARILERDEALAELARRFFSSHGPATLRDYVWWSGLTGRDAKRGLEMVEPALVREVIDARTYWFAAPRSPAAGAPPPAYLLPNYDEYLIAYKDRAPVQKPTPRVKNIGTGGFAHHLVIDGRLAGSWRRTLKKDSVVVEAAPYGDLSRADARALAAAAERYGRFLRVGVVLLRG